MAKPNAPRHLQEVTPGWRGLVSSLFSRMQFFQALGLTFDGKRDYYKLFGYKPILNSYDYRDRFARGGIAARIVEAYPKATWRGGAEICEDDDPKVDTAFEQAFEALNERLRIWSVLQRGDILAGLSQFSVVLIGAPGELEQELPKGNPDKLLYMTPFSGGIGTTAMAMSSGSAAFLDATIAEFDEDPKSPRFGLPLTYQLRRVDISAPQLTRPVHWSRVIHIAEGLLDNEVYGVPTLESVWNLLDDLMKCCAGGAEAFFQRANQGLILNMDKDLAIKPEAEAKLKDQVEDYMHNISRVLRTRGIEASTLGSDVADFSNACDAILTQIAGAKGIPKRILMGSEMGQLASGQDRDNWDTQVEDRRTGYAGPMIVRQLLDRLIAYGYLPEPKEYEVKWPKVFNLTETDKATGAKEWAIVNRATGITVFTDDEIRDHWFQLPPLPPEVKKANAEAQKAALAPKAGPPNGAFGGKPGDRSAPGAGGKGSNATDAGGAYKFNAARADETLGEDEAALAQMLLLAVESGQTEMVDAMLGLDREAKGQP